LLCANADLAPACPAAAVAGQGITLSLDGNRVRLSESNPAAPKSFPREAVLLHGLLPLESRSPSARSRTVYAPEAERMFPLAPGKEHEVAYTSQIEGRPPVRARLALAVVEALQHTIGTCTYDALLIARISEFESGHRTPVRYDVYVPALQAVVKSTMFDEESRAIVEQETFEAEKIAGN
jgi:hypothetical protein